MGIFDKILKSVVGLFVKKKEPELGKPLIKPSEAARGIKGEVVKGTDVRDVQPTVSKDIKLDVSKKRRKKKEPEEKERGTIDVVRDFLFGNVLEKDPFTGEKRIDPETGEPVKVAMGTVPIGPGGAKVVADISKQFPGVSRAVLTQVQRQKDVATATNLLKGIKPGDSKWAIFGKTVLSNLKKNPIKWVAGITLGGVYVAKEFLWSPGVLASWAAVDNVAGLISFTSKDINAGYQEGDITLKEGEDFYAEAFDKLDSSESWVRKQMRINPLLLFGAGKQMLLAVETARTKTTVSKQTFDGIDPDEETWEEAALRRDIEDTLFFQAKDKIEAGLEITTEEVGILEARNYEINTQEQVNRVWDARRGGDGRDISEDIAKRDIAEEAEFRERTLLFEAIKKRNARVSLSTEEIALLEKYGLQPYPIGDEYGRSNLGFGLLR